MTGISQGNSSPGAGDLRERVTLQARTESTDTQGGKSVTPTTLATVWACVRLAAAGAESKQGGQVTGSTTYLVDIRYSPDVSGVTTKHQVSWRGKTLNIAAVVVAERRDMITLTCAEVAA